jgi:hypothetical protein
VQQERPKTIVVIQAPERSILASSSQAASSLVSSLSAAWSKYNFIGDFQNQETASEFIEVDP